MKRGGFVCVWSCGCSPRSWRTLCPPTLGGLASQGPSSPPPRSSCRSSPSPPLPPAETRTEDEGCAPSLRLQGGRREREFCVLGLDRSHLCLLASFKGLLENSKGVTASASTFGPNQTHLVALSCKLTVRNYWNTCHELLTMFSYFARWTMDILQSIVCLHLSVGHHE